MTESLKDTLSARLEGFVLNKIKSLQLIQYLSTGKYPEGLDKKDRRNIRNNSRTHTWDAQSKLFQLFYMLWKGSTYGLTLKNVSFRGRVALCWK